MRLSKAYPHPQQQQQQPPPPPPPPPPPAPNQFFQPISPTRMYHTLVF